MSIVRFAALALILGIPAFAEAAQTLTLQPFKGEVQYRVGNKLVTVLGDKRPYPAIPANAIIKSISGNVTLKTSDGARVTLNKGESVAVNTKIQNGSEVVSFKNTSKNGDVEVILPGETVVLSPGGSGDVSKGARSFSHTGGDISVKRIVGRADLSSKPEIPTTLLKDEKIEEIEDVETLFSPSAP